MTTPEKETDPAPEEAPAPTGKPPNLLDSVFREDGPMPPARMRIRILAFFLDFALITAVASVIIWQFAIPRAYPGTLAEFSEWSRQFVDWLGAGSGQSAAPPEMSNNLSRALAYARDLQLIIFWVYFAAGEAFFAGSSLGKRACRLRTVSTVTLGAPPILTGIVRGGLKTVALFFIFPLALIATLGALFFNKRRQMGHDLLSRTAVVDEKFVNLEDKD